MPRSRFLGPTVLTVALAVTQFQAGWSDEPKPSSPDKPSLFPATPKAATAPKATESAKAGATCVIYPLAELGRDPGLAKWVAETIPDMIAPSSWSQVGGTGRITHNATSQVLVVYQSAAVHAQVETFLNDLRKAGPGGAAKPAVPVGKVVSAHYTDAGLIKPADPVTKGQGYPVPPPLQQPKHLFHLVIRYEGDGIVDANVASMVKDIVAAAREDGAGDKKAVPDAAKPTSQMNHLFHFVVRYEGEGIIDSNVAAMLKDI